MAKKSLIIKFNNFLKENFNELDPYGEDNWDDRNDFHFSEEEIEHLKDNTFEIKKDIINNKIVQYAIISRHLKDKIFIKDRNLIITIGFVLQGNTGYKYISKIEYSYIDNMSKLKKEKLKIIESNSINDTLLKCKIICKDQLKIK